MPETKGFCIPTIIVTIMLVGGLILHITIGEQDPRFPDQQDKRVKVSWNSIMINVVTGIITILIFFFLCKKGYTKTSWVLLLFPLFIFVFIFDIFTDNTTTISPTTVNETDTEAVAVPVATAVNTEPNIKKIKSITISRNDTDVVENNLAFADVSMVNKTSSIIKLKCDDDCVNTQTLTGHTGLMGIDNDISTFYQSLEDATSINQTITYTLETPTILDDIETIKLVPVQDSTINNTHYNGVSVVLKYEDGTTASTYKLSPLVAKRDYDDNLTSYDITLKTHTNLIDEKVYKIRIEREYNPDDLNNKLTFNEIELYDLTDTRLILECDNLSDCESSHFTNTNDGSTVSANNLIDGDYSTLYYNDFITQNTSKTDSWVEFTLKTPTKDLKKIVFTINPNSSETSFDNITILLYGGNSNVIKTFPFNIVLNQTTDRITGTLDFSNFDTVPTFKLNGQSSISEVAFQTYNDFIKNDESIHSLFLFNNEKNIDKIQVGADSQNNPIHSAAQIEIEKNYWAVDKSWDSGAQAVKLTKSTSNPDGTPRAFIPYDKNISPTDDLTYYALVKVKHNKTTPVSGKATYRSSLPSNFTHSENTFFTISHLHDPYYEEGGYNLKDNEWEVVKWHAGNPIYKTLILSLLRPGGKWAQNSDNVEVWVKWVMVVKKTT